MYPYYAKWIRSHRDLPLKLNQWNSVVRWEFKHPQPFLRTREFLWQEGHTAHMSRELAEEEVMQILQWYQGVYEDILAVPTIKGKKTEKEKFAGGLFTTTCEGYIPATGRGIQGATSHCLGQNFSKMFNISVENPNWKEGDNVASKKLYVWQNSWGLSTRVIGVMVMVHGDNKGLVLPPAAAEYQVVIVPCGITAKTTDEQRKRLLDAVEELEKQLVAAGIRVEADTRDTYSPGYKFNDWELKGVPLRLEFGPKDMEKKQVVAVRRDTGVKESVSLQGVADAISKMLQTIQQDLFNKAKKSFDDHVKIITKWEDVVSALDAKNVILMPHCEILQPHSTAHS
jgi:prolyl-tRNA synthetase